MVAAGILAVGLLVAFGVAFRLGAFSRDDEQEMLWKVQTEEMIFSSPVSKNGVVYIGNFTGYLHALDARTGAARWRFTADAAAATPNSTPVPATATPSSTPVWERALSGHYSINSIAVSDGVVYAGSSDNNLYAIDATTGRERWRFTTMGSIYSTPVIVAGVVYVGSYDHHLYAIDAATGTERWRFAAGGSSVSSPLLVNGFLYVGSLNGGYYAIEAATGTERWRFQTERSIEALSPSFAHGIVYIASRHGALYGIDAQTGIRVWELNWEKEMDTGLLLPSSPHVINDIVYLPASETLYAFPAPERPSRTHDGDAVSIHVVPAVTDRADVARPQRTGQRRVAGGAPGREPADRRSDRARLRQPGR
jgi:outer membrane protein assembly factor BamB